MPPGSVAMFTPLRKKAKTSLYCDPTNSLYSSEENTYWNEICEALAQVKSNSRLHASKVGAVVSASSCASPGIWFAVEVELLVLGPSTEAMLPDDSMMPLSMPMIGRPLWNVPAAMGAPCTTMFEATTPGPSSDCTSCGRVSTVMSVVTSASTPVFAAALVVWPGGRAMRRGCCCAANGPASAAMAAMSTTEQDECIEILGTDMASAGDRLRLG